MNKDCCQKLLPLWKIISVSLVLLGVGCTTLPEANTYQNLPEQIEDPESLSLIMVPDFYSPELENHRTLRILLPKSYASTTSSFPVVYFHDGQNVFSPGGKFGTWAVEEAYARLLSEGKIQEAILVGIDNSANRLAEYTPTSDPKYGGGAGDRYLDFLQNTLIPYVNSKFRTLKGPENTALLGSSLGGLITFYAGWTRPEVFGMVGCLSSAFWWDGEKLLNTVRTHNGDSSKEREHKVKFYLDAGNKEGTDPDKNGTTYVLENTLDMALALQKLGYKTGQDLFLDLDPLGQHTEKDWSERVSGPLQFFLGPPPVRITAVLPVATRKVLAVGGNSANFFPFVGAQWDNGMRGDLLPGDYQIILPENGNWSRSDRGEITLEKSNLGSGDTARFLFKAGGSQGMLEIKIMN